MIPLRIEDNLRPPTPADPYPRDVLSVLMLLILASVLIPAWDMARETLVPMVAAHMASSLLLMSLGFLLALRCGAIDLSVWAVAGVGGLVAAGLINAGFGLTESFAIAAGAGLGIGLVSGVLVGGLGLPSPLVTAGVGLVAIWAAGRLVAGRELMVPEQTFDDYLFHPTGVLGVRVLLVSAIYVTATAAMMGVDVLVWSGNVFSRRGSLVAAMAASGLLAGLGGATALIDHCMAPVPTRLIDDLRVPAAALLAGGLFLGRRGRELLAALCLPSSLLICTIWRQKVWILPSPGIGLAVQMLLMMGMVISVHLAMARWLAAKEGRAGLTQIGVLLTAVGTVLVAAAANFDSSTYHELMHICGVGVWLAGMPAIVIAMRRERTRARGEMEDPTQPPLMTRETE